MRKLLLWITRYVFLEDLICVLAVMTLVNINWVIIHLKYGLARIITIQGMIYFFLVGARYDLLVSAESCTFEFH